MAGELGGVDKAIGNAVKSYVSDTNKGDIDKGLHDLNPGYNPNGKSVEVGGKTFKTRGGGSDYNVVRTERKGVE